MPRPGCPGIGSRPSASQGWGGRARGSGARCSRASPPRRWQPCHNAGMGPHGHQSGWARSTPDKNTASLHPGKQKSFYRLPVQVALVEAISRGCGGTRASSRVSWGHYTPGSHPPQGGVATTQRYGFITEAGRHQCLPLPLTSAAAPQTTAGRTTGRRAYPQVPPVTAGQSPGSRCAWTRVVPARRAAPQTSFAFPG